MTAIARAVLVPVLLLASALGAAGCVYRPNIQQGNLLKVEDVEQVTTGMTRSQVRYLLGTPMLADPFDPQRWDYIYTFHRGRQTKYDRAHFVVRFDGDTVSKVEKLDVPDGATDPNKKKKKKTPELPEMGPHEPGLPPPAGQPQPDTSRPGGAG